MIFRQNYKDVKGYLKYHSVILHNEDTTVRGYWVSFKRILTWCDDVPFSEFYKAKITLPEYLRKMVLSQEINEQTASDTCSLFKEFLRFQMSENHARYGKLKQSQIAENKFTVHADSAKMPKYVSIEEINKIAEYTPENLIQQRAQASACFLFLSGMRAGAFVTIPINCVDLEKRNIYQFPEKGVHTKFTKRAITTLLPLPKLLEIVKRWDDLVRKNCPSDSAWFARLDDKEHKKLGVGTFATEFNPFIPENQDTNTGRILSMRRRGVLGSDLNMICDLVGIERKNPHAFRHGHIHYGLSNASSMEQFKAISQNVMHNNTSITDEIYSRMNHEKLNDVIGNMGAYTETEKPKITGVMSADILSGMTIDEKKQLLKELLGL